MNNGRHIETKDSFEEDIKLDEFFKDSKNFENFNDKIKQKSIVTKFLVKKLGYNSFNRGAPLLDRNGKEATIKGIINDIKGALQLNSDFSVDLALCEAFRNYIDFEVTNINVEVPIDIEQEEQEFLKKIQGCPKVINVGYGIEDTPENSKKWLEDANIAYAINIYGEEIYASIEEILERYNTYKKYSGERQEYYTSYDYFVRQELEVHNIEMFEEIGQIEDWTRQKEIDRKQIKLKINADRTNAKKFIESYVDLYSKNDKYCADVNIGLIKLPQYLESEKSFRVLDEERLKQMHQCEEMGMNFRASCSDKICMYVETIAEIDEATLERYNISYVMIGKKENGHENILTISEYRKIRRILDEVVEGIDINESEERRVKTVYTRLGNMLTYDKEAAEDNTEYAIKNKEKSRNLVNGLLLGKCVCAGYAEILRQALSLVGIESHYIVSKDDASGDSHAYNVIKIKGNWYNADLTWDSPNIRNKIRPKYFLKNDQEFRELDEDEKNLHIPEDEEYACSEKSINLYKEYKKDNALNRFVNDAREAFEEIGPKQAMHNLVRNVGKLIKFKLTPKRNLLPEASGVVASKPKKEKSFKEELKEGTPTIEEQAYNQQENNEVEKNLNDIEVVEKEK